MNKFIKEELLKCKSVEIPTFTDDTLQIIIPRRSEQILDAEKFELNQCYLVHLEEYIIKPYPGFTLHDNWNKGVVPKYQDMKIYVNKKIGKMIFVDAIAYDATNGTDINYSWSGWLPEGSINIIKKI